MIKTLERAIPWTEEHKQFREMTADFFQKEVVPNMEAWGEQGQVTREIWKKAGSVGLLCPNFPEQYGAAGVDFLYNVIISEESAACHNNGFFITLHNDVIAPYILEFADEEQKKRWLPGCVSGDHILAIGMTEPNTGSDLGAIKTTAEDKGDHFLLNGSKTFISNGQLGDLIIVVAKTAADRGIHGISLMMVEADMPGFKRGRNLKKIGLKAQDTSELFFEDVKVPKENLIGKSGHGFRYLMTSLQQERLALAIGNMAGAEAVLKETVEYVKTRQAFGQSIGKFQHIRFRLAELATEQAAGRALLDQVILAHMRGQKAMVQASQVKLMCSEMLKRHADECLQFFGGYGYMMEYPIAGAYLDARVQTIYGGTSEIMKEIIASGGLGL